MVAVGEMVAVFAVGALDSTGAMVTVGCIGEGGADSLEGYVHLVQYDSDCSNHGRI
jgi:hypothetical protein